MFWMQNTTQYDSLVRMKVEVCFISDFVSVQFLFYLYFYFKFYVFFKPYLCIVRNKSFGVQGKFQVHIWNIFLAKI